VALSMRSEKETGVDCRVSHQCESEEIFDQYLVTNQFFPDSIFFVFSNLKLDWNPIPSL